MIASHVVVAASLMPLPEMGDKQGTKDELKAKAQEMNK